MDNFLKTCSNLNVPLFIVSAALTDIVDKSIDVLIDEINDIDNIEKARLHIIANNSQYCP
jgi:predicted metal-dependent peptidase